MRLVAVFLATGVDSISLAGPALAAPAPAITVTSSAILVSTMPFGPITSCPVTVNFGAAIRAALPVGAKREVQYKWVDESGADSLTQTAVIPTAAGIASVLSSAEPVDVTTSRKLSAGKHWEQLQITYPAVVTTERVNFTITCPTAGALTLGQ